MMAGIARSGFGAAVLAAAIALVPFCATEAADGMSTLVLQGEGECRISSFEYGSMSIGSVLQVPLYPGGGSLTIQFPAWYIHDELEALPLDTRQIQFALGDDTFLAGCQSTSCPNPSWKPACAGTTYVWDVTAPGTLTFGPPDAQSQTCGCEPGGAVQPQ